MSVETARMIFYPAAIVLGLIWLIGIRYAFARLHPAPRREDRAFSSSAPADRDAIEGEVVIEGEPEALARALASQLATSGAWGAGMRITACTAERVAFERIPGLGLGRRRRILFDRGVATLRREGDRVRVRYEVSLRRTLGILRLLMLLLCVPLSALFVFGVPIAIGLLVLPHEDPPVRAQVFQVLQMAHGVWPPFLIGFLASRMRKMAGAYFETLLSNLPHVA